MPRVPRKPSAHHAPSPAPRRSTPRVARPRPASLGKSADRSLLDSSPIIKELPIVGEEKHHLILAHAAARAGKAMGGGVWMFRIGIVASFLVVVSGWWLTLNTTIRRPLPTQESSLIQQVREEVQRTSEQYPLEKPTIPNGIEQQSRTVQQEFDELFLQDQALRESAAQINARNTPVPTSTQP